MSTIEISIDDETSRKVFEGVSSIISNTFEVIEKIGLKDDPRRAMTALANVINVTSGLAAQELKLGSEHILTAFVVIAADCGHLGTLHKIISDYIAKIEYED